MLGNQRPATLVQSGFHLIGQSNARFGWTVQPFLVRAVEVVVAVVHEVAVHVLTGERTNECVAVLASVPAECSQHPGHLTGGRFGVGEGTATGNDRFITIDALVHRAVIQRDAFHDRRALCLARVGMWHVV